MKNVTGKDAALALDNARITVNKNLIPFDDKSPFITSGIRLGTPAATTRGMKEDDMRRVAGFIDEVISDWKNTAVIEKVKSEVGDLVKKFPLYPDLIEEMEKL